LRYACAALLTRRYLGWDISLRKLLLVLPKDLMISVIWLLAFGGDTVTWSGRRFRVRRDGRMSEIGSPAVAPPRRAPIETPTAWPQVDADSTTGSR
jgi:hypothetical protein